MNYNYGVPILLSATLNEFGEMEIIKKYPSMISLGNGMEVPAIVEKEVYKAHADGVIRLEKTIVGKHTPQHIVLESIEFDE